MCTQPYNNNDDGLKWSIKIDLLQIQKSNFLIFWATVFIVSYIDRKWTYFVRSSFNESINIYLQNTKAIASHHKYYVNFCAIMNYHERAYNTIGSFDVELSAITQMALYINQIFVDH